MTNHIFTKSGTFFIFITVFSFFFTSCTMRYEKLSSTEPFENDANGRPFRMEQMANGKKNGPAIYIYYHKPREPKRVQGQHRDDKRVGVWSNYTGKGDVAPDGSGRWHKTSNTTYDDQGKALQKEFLHPNGKVRLEISYGDDGESSWYRRFDKRGRLVDEGKVLPTELE